MISVPFFFISYKQCGGGFQVLEVSPQGVVITVALDPLLALLVGAVEDPALVPKANDDILLDTVSGAVDFVEFSHGLVPFVLPTP
jgi:hypothetical protein